jgi:membrane-associated protease RseP (regulator of RpoE activity)
MRLVLILLSAAFSGSVTVLAQDAALGIRSHHIDPESAEVRDYFFPYGSLVSSVYPNSGAKDLGLEALDYLYQINDEKVSQDRSISAILEDYRPGESVNVYYERAGRLRSGTLRLSDADDLEEVHRSSEQDPFLGISSTHAEKPSGVKGAIVNVLNNSTAQAMGMENKDIITKIDGKPIFAWSDLGGVIDERSVGDIIEVQYYRDGKLFEESRPIKSRAATHNTHSRPDGPVIVGDIDPVAPPSEVVLNDLPPEVETPAIADMPNGQMPRLNSISIEQLNVFPNPSDGIFNIQLDLPEEGRTSIQVFNSQGQRVYENNLGNFSGVFSDRIDISSTAKGIFFLLVRQGDQTLSKQLMLQ